MAELFVPLFGIFFLFGAPIIAFVIFRVLAHRERMEMIRHGLDPGPRASKDWQRAQTAARGYGPEPYAGAFSKHSPQAALRKGASTAAVGFALLIGLSFIGYHDGPLGSTIRPGPWLLGGLIPFFVGLAQVFIAVMSGALGTSGGVTACLRPARAGAGRTAAAARPKALRRPAITPVAIPIVPVLRKSCGRRRLHRLNAIAERPPVRRKTSRGDAVRASPLLVLGL